MKPHLLRNREIFYVKRFKGAGSPSWPSRIMVKGVNWIGDTVLSLPSIQALREVFPEAFITVYTLTHLVGLISHNPCVNEVVGYRRRGGLNGVLDQWRLVDLYRKGGYDLAIILPNSFSSALLPFMARIPVRIGYARNGRSILLTHPVPCPDEIRKVHHSLYYLNIVGNLGKVSEGQLPIIKLKDEEKRWAHMIIHGEKERAVRWVVGICPGAAYGPAKRWFAHRYIELAKRLMDRADARIILFGSEQEAVEIRIMAKRIGGDCIDMSGRTTIVEMASLMALCDLVISNDTGPMHVAGAIGTPVIAIFGSTDPSATSPLGRAKVIRKGDVHCSPCFKRTCPKKTYECMERISTEEVLEAALHVLKSRE